jgi:hypothetical protein
MANWLALPENYKVCEGSAVKHAIFARLASCPQALPLALRVSDFYGDSLIYRESRRFSSSFYQIQFNSDQTELQYARIDLQLGTNRTAEAVCHELLHLEMAIRGYPLPVESYMPGELVPHGQLLGMQSIVSNLLGHKICFHQFLKLGLDGKKFLADKASASLLWRSRIHHQMEKCILRMTDYLESGLPNDVLGYPLFCNTLLALMRLPQYTKWVILEKGHRRPSVRRIPDRVVFPKS